MPPSISEKEAQTKAAQVDYLLLRLKQRLIDLPPGVGIVDFLQYDGKPPGPAIASDGSGSTAGQPDGATLARRAVTTLVTLRDRYLETGNAPSIRSLGKESGVPIKELYELFPKGPAKLAAKIAGIPKPRGCI